MPVHHGGASRAAEWAAVWTLLAEQEGHQVVKVYLEVIKVIPGKHVPERIEEQTVVTAVAKSADEARPLGIAKHSASAESDVAVSPGEDGPSWSRTSGTTSAGVSEVARTVGGAQPLVS